MRITDLIFLIELSHSKSITLTSGRMHISQQGLSQVISRLEQELDAKLFHRSRHGISLTDAGQIAVQKAKEIIEKYDELRIELEQLKQGQEQLVEGNLTLSHTHVSGTAVLPKALKLFKTKYPNVNLTIKEKAPLETIAWIQENPTVVGLINYPEAQEQGKGSLLQAYPGLVYKEILRDELIVCVPKSWDLNKEQLGSANAMVKLPMVYYDTQQYEEIIAQIFSRADLPPKIFLKTLNNELFRQTIIDGLAMGAFSMLELNENRLLKEFTVQSDMRLKLIYTWATSAEHPVSLPAQKFLECLESTAKTMND
ncbi:MAG TPA: LysR family transcriptional regulator [Desulfitobacterium dehalogenans]|uniref:LysR family transcriptional regulator n=1 Tax=Desulfitobacterium dehalogenans TaxID=36854 RepID=A0A7C6Z4S4_9FIRM|nr:LysR family transcriptional regulator [Desulfitobacterium dehalogenans]